MKLYGNKYSTTTRAVLLFCEENNVDVEFCNVDLMSGEHRGEAFAKVNPSMKVPALVDGDFHLAESAAILKYLAQKTKSKQYPSDLQQQAKVDEMVSWFGTNLSVVFGYNLVYPQLFPHHKRGSDESNSECVKWGVGQSNHLLKILNDKLIGKNNYVCGNEVTIADYLGISLVTLGDVIGEDFAEYPNICRWISNMKKLKSWNSVNDAFYQFAESLKGKEFITLCDGSNEDKRASA